MSWAPVSTADLLACFAALDPAERELAAEAAGFEQIKQPSVIGDEEVPPTEDSEKRGTPPGPLQPPPAKADSGLPAPPRFWRVVADLPNDERRTEAPAWLVGETAIDFGQFVSDPDAARPAPAPLLRPARLARFLRQQLARNRPGADIDVTRVVRHFAERRALDRLPPATKPSWPGRVNVLLDAGHVLGPVRGDLRAIAARIVRDLAGRARLSVVDGDPEQLLRPARRDHRSPPGPESVLRVDGVPTVVLGDAGLYQRHDPVHRRWIKFGRRLQAAGARALLLAPVPRRMIDAATLGAFATALLDDGANLRLLARGCAPSADDATRAPATTETSLLRSALFGNACVDAALLRSLRRRLADLGVDVDIATEVAVHADPSVDGCGALCAITPDKREAVAAEFAQLAPPLRDAVIDEHWRALQAGSPLIRAEYALAVGRVTKFPATLQPAPVAPELFQRMSALMHHRRGGEADSIAAYIGRFAARNAEQIGSGDERVQASWVLAHRDALAGGRVVPPPGLDLDRFRWAFDEAEDRIRLQLHVESVIAAGGEIGARIRVENEAASRYPLLTVSAADRHWSIEPSTDAFADARDLVKRIRGMRTSVADAPPPELVRALRAIRRDDTPEAEATYDSHLIGTLMSAVLPHSGDTGAEYEESRAGVSFLGWLGECCGSRHANAIGAFRAALDAARPESAVATQAPGAVPIRSGLRPGTSVSFAAERRQRIASGMHSVEIESFVRPSWAESVAFDGGEWIATLPGGRRLVWVPRGLWYIGEGPNWGGADFAVRSVAMASAPTYRLPAPCWWDEAEYRAFLLDRNVLWQPPWAQAHGVDEYGYWAELRVERTVQRLRFVPPGMFWMGSPASEHGRFNDEVLHRVTLTRGFWLADTACTEAFWNATVGEAPLRSEGPDRPVVDVSWHDIVTQLLPRLPGRERGGAWRLPTEAEWEYACRAGTLTPFWFGEDIRANQANFDADSPYRGPPLDRPIGTRTDVRSYPPNPWGLFEMHGNVWEWCSDESVQLDETEVIDPRAGGDSGPGGRVLRGGSWIHDARRCRSAARRASDPGLRHDLIGFRLARGLLDQPDGRAEPGTPEASAESGDGAPDSAARRPAARKPALKSAKKPKKAKK